MLHTADLVIIFVYLAFTVMIGILAKGRQSSAEDYFTTSGKMGSVFMSILVGLSIAATLFSGITFVGFTGIVIKEGIGIVLGVLAFPVALLVLYAWFIPRYLADQPQSPYDVVEKRFGMGVRLVTSATFVLARIGWMGTLIYAPTIALIAAGNLGEGWFWPIILTIGLSSTLYTVLGGIRGVVVTDALQFVVIAAGIIWTVLFIVLKLPVSMGEAVSYLRQEGYLNVFDFSLDFRSSITFWSILFGYTTATLAGYLSDQMCLQRYIATGSAKSAVRSLLVSIVGSMVVLTLLATVGVLLLSWFHFQPDANMPENPDKTFTYFVSSYLPTGSAGLVLAGLLAATMSSMTSGINTLASTVTMDFRMRLGKAMTPRRQLLFARIASLIIGVAATITAGVFQNLGQVFEIVMALGGMLGGSFLLAVVLAVLRVRIAPAAVIAGMIITIISGSIIVFSEVANIWGLPVSMVCAFVFLAVYRLLSPRDERGLDQDNTSRD